MHLQQPRFFNWHGVELDMVDLSTPGSCLDMLPLSAKKILGHPDVEQLPGSVVMPVEPGCSAEGEIDTERHSGLMSRFHSLIKS